MRYPRPYYRRQRDSWCVQIGRKQITLARGKDAEAEAMAAYHRLMTAEGIDVPRPEMTAAAAADLFMDDVKARVAPATYEQYRIKLQSFLDRCGGIKVRRLGPRHVADWLAAHPNWSDSTRRGALTYLRLCMRWCVKRGYADADPTAEARRPRMGRRSRTIDPAERAAIRGAAGPALADFLDALGWTGARPGEVMRLEARHIDWDAAYAALPGKTTRATGEPVEFPLVPPMLALCQRLADAHPSGPLFRNSGGNPWTANAVRCAMRRLRKRLGIAGVTAYTYRHSFATDALVRGLSISDVAALLNHRDVRTTMGYAHVGQRRAHLRKQAERATGDGDGEVSEP